MPILQELGSRRSGDGLAVVGIDVDRGDLEISRKFVADLKLGIVAKPFRHNAPRVDIYLNEGFAPIILPKGGTFNGQVTVSLSSMAGDAIYYTKDGGTPGTNSIRYSGPFTLNTSGTVKAVSVANGTVLTNSFGTNALSRAAFTINPEYRTNHAIRRGCRESQSGDDPFQ